MNGLETAKAGLHTRAERLEGRDGAGKCRVPTGGGNRQRVQDRYVSAGLAKSDIRVPVAPSEQALAVGLLSHFQHFGNTFGMNDAVVGVVTEQWAEVCDEIPQCRGTQRDVSSWDAASVIPRNTAPMCGAIGDRLIVSVSAMVTSSTEVTAA